MRPESSYSGGVTFSGTGLQFNSEPQVVKDSISVLKRKNPGVKVLVAVGGATFTNFGSLNADSIAMFVKEFGLDGVDLDYEPSNSNCVISQDKTSISCSTDEEYISSVNKLRAALPRPFILSNAPWSVGAYGLEKWAGAQPSSIYTGVAINMLKQVGDKLDLLNVMSYDASNAYSPVEAFEAYSHYFKGDIAMGIEVANEAWGGHVITIDEVDELADAILRSGRATNGLMLWSLQKRADQGPTAQEISQRVCSLLNLPSCSCSLSNVC
jgi:chitinase